MNSHVIASESVDTLSTAAWELPVVDGPRANTRRRPTLAELEGVERIAWDEGFAKGRDAGMAAGNQEAQRLNDDLRGKIQRADALLNSLARPMEQLDETIEQLCVQLSMTIAKHLLRRELRTDPTQVIAIVRETVALLPLGQRNVRVHMHPLDAAVVHERLSEPRGERAWSIVEDPVMGRGGCRVSTDTAQIDARLEARLMAVMNQLLGEDRADEIRNAETDQDGAQS